MGRRIGSANREAERRILDAMQIRLAARAERALGAELARQYRAAADAIERQEPLPAIPRDGTGRIILAAWETAATAFGNRMFDALGKRGRLRMERKDLSAGFRAAFLAFAEEWLAVKITQISETTADQIRQLVVEGEQDGASVEAIAKRIRSEAMPMSRLRAHVIARTETHFAAGWANEQAASEADITLVKEWAATADSRTRESHLEADGQTVPMGQAFDVGGYALRYPGDAAGPAEEVINCRCQALYLEP